MKTTIAILLASMSGVATAKTDTDYPHRDWGKELVLDMSLIDATACITREKGRQGTATVIPAEGGNDIDFKVAPVLFAGPSGEPWETFKVRESNGVTTLKVFYRHPYRQATISKDMAKLAKKCLRVKSGL